MLAGKSGIEIAAQVLLEITGKEYNIIPNDHFSRQKNIGLAGQLLIISGTHQESTAKFSKRYRLMI